MANEFSKQVKFVADVAGIYESLNKLISDIKSMQASLVVNLVTPDGRPIDQILRGGMAGGGSFVQTPSGVYAPSGIANVKRTPGERSDPVQGQSPGPLYQTEFQKLRQDNSSYQYLESQRAISNRQNAMSITTGGKDGNQFLSDKIAELSKANNPQLQGTIQAITSLKDKFDELGKLIAALNENEKIAIGDQEKLASISKEREDAVRSQQQILQSAGGFGDQNEPTPSWMEKLMKGIAGGVIIKGATQVLQDVLAGPSGALESNAAISNSAMITVNAARRMSAEDILVNLNPEAQAKALSVAGLAPYSSLVGGIGDAASGAYVGSKVAGTQGAIAGGIGAGALDLANPISQVVMGGHPWDASVARAYGQALSAISGIEGGNIAMGEEYLKRAGGRTSFGRAFGYTAGDMDSFAKTGLQVNTANTGVSEEDQLTAMSGLYRMIGTKNIDSRVSALMRNGMDASAVGRLGNGSFATGESDPFGRGEDILARAVTRGLNNWPLAQEQAENIQKMAASVGGFSGPSGLNAAERFTRIAGDIYGQGMAGQVASGVFGTIAQERNQRSGMQGMVNFMTASSVLPMFTSANGLRQQELLMGLMRDPSQFENKDVQSHLMDLFPEARKKGFFQDLQNRLYASGEGNRRRMNPFMQAGEGDPFLAALGIDTGTAGDIAARQSVSTGLMGNRGLTEEAKADFNLRGAGIDKDNPLIAQLKAIDLASSHLASGGLALLNTGLSTMGDSLKKLTDALAIATAVAAAQDYSPASIVARNKAALSNNDNEKSRKLVEHNMDGRYGR